MRPIPKKAHEAQETAAEEKREHATGQEAHPDSPMARRMKRKAKRKSRRRRRK